MKRMKVRFTGPLLADWQTITAAGEPVDGMAPGFSAVLVIEGERTTDDREIVPGALTWRELPIALTNAEDVGDDHYGEVVGRIESVSRVEVGEGRNEIRATGTFDLGSDAGREAARLVAEQVKRWVSIDLEVIAHDLIEEGDCGLEEDPDSVGDLLFPEDCHIIMRVVEGRIMGAAMCAFSAFPSAVIVPEGAEIPDATNDGRPAVEAEEEVEEAEAADLDAPTDFALAASGAKAPPAEWFDDPALDGPTPLTITDDGRVFGHLALWGTCHIGREDVCLTPPRSSAGYSYFRTGETLVDCGDCGGKLKSIPTGALTMGTGHADLHMRAAAAAEHYDNTGAAFADVAAGEDAYGIWVAGALREGLTEGQMRSARASALSGDWRRIGTDLELVAALAVNVPGFPIPRAVAAAGVVQEAVRVRASSREGRQMALVASGVVRRRTSAVPVEVSRLAERVERLERFMTPQMRAALRAAVRN